MFDAKANTLKSKILKLFFKSWFSPCYLLTWTNSVGSPKRLCRSWIDDQISIILDDQECSRVAECSGRPLWVIIGVIDNKIAVTLHNSCFGCIIISHAGPQSFIVWLTIKDQVAIQLHSNLEAIVGWLNVAVDLESVSSHSWSRNAKCIAIKWEIWIFNFLLKKLFYFCVR